MTTNCTSEQNTVYYSNTESALCITKSLTRTGVIWTAQIHDSWTTKKYHRMFQHLMQRWTLKRYGSLSL